MIIYIPTVRRVGLAEKRTLKWIPDNWKEKTFLVVDEREASQYSYPRLMVLAKKFAGIGPTRQCVINNTKDPYVLFLDDDLQFYSRPIKGDHHLRNATLSAMDVMFEALESWMKNGIVHVGVSAREGNNRVLTPYTENTRVIRALGYNADVLQSYRKTLNFCQTQCMEDFNITLGLLRRGHPNRVLYHFAQGQIRSNAPGGCSIYRDEAMQARSAHKLAELHPGFVRVLEKKTKTAWKEMGGVRTDVMVYWKKAYASSQE